MAEPVLTFTNVHHRHAVPAPKAWKPWAKQAGAGIHGINLSLYPGQVLGLIGPNGAGKTTLLRVMAGVLPLREGTVTSHENGFDRPVHDLRYRTGHMPEQVRWQGTMTVMEILEQLSEMRGHGDHHLGPLLTMVGLQGRSEEALDRLSQGMRQRLSIAAALLGSPKVLLLDEPFNGLDPVAAEAFASLIRRLIEKGVSVVISSHMVTQLEGLIDRIALMHRGQLLDEGPLNEVEKRLMLDARYRLEGPGSMTSTAFLEPLRTEILSTASNGDSWSLTVRGEAEAVLDACKAQGVDVQSWAPVKPNLVEWLCAATGMSFDDISLDVASSAMVPMATAEVMEDE